jgi:hypothetical protein
MSEIRFSESKRFFSDYSPVNRSEMVRVRREIRDLSSSEWNTVVRALWVMKNTTTEDGRRLYGSDFISYDAMVSKHITAGVVYSYALLSS